MPGHEDIGVGVTTPNQMGERMPLSLLDNMSAAVCDALGVQSLSHKSALIDLCGREAIPAGSVRAAYETIAENWRLCRQAGGGGNSRQNWRWREPQLTIAAHNASPEVVLERALVGSLERLGINSWANQIPAASGVAGPARERRRAIDLVHQLGPAHFELIELKVGSDTPLYAAFEIIAYTCIWLLSRQDLAPPVSPLLAASALEVIVWAPAGFYDRYDLSKLARQLETELAELGLEQGVRLRFRFDTFPDDLAKLPYTDQQVLTLLDARAPL